MSGAQGVEDSMISPMEPHRKWCLTLLVVLVSAHSDTKVTSSQHMDDFIRVLEQVEDSNPGLEPVNVLRGLRRTAGLRDEFMQHFLGTIREDSTSEAPVMDSNLSDFIGRAMRHKVTERGIEEGVVLTADGTTVAMSPVLLGIEAGLLSETRCRFCGLYPLTLARNLGLSFQRFHSSLLSQRLGPDGCWDDVTSPQVFTLSDKPSLATDALVNGGMDGVILGIEVSAQSQRPLKLSSLLRRYYCHHLEGEGLDAAPRLISQLRRENFRELARPHLLQRQVVRSLVLQRRLIDHSTMLAQEKEELTAVVREGIKEFVHRYMDCPAIIPRCQWGAAPYRGTPTPLSLPLSFMYIHHTYQPGQPCLTFQQCSADMRSMQRFHQDDRGWDDIGYSFVAGSDGYLYEGRGWHWQGAHTKGYNSKGYGVSFIGDYTSSLPSQQTMELVRDRLASCAVGGGRLVGNFTLYGHRQLVKTSCPGDAFYSEITGWEHFGEVQN
ncbi:N-acetylmuramoyl-L-alanine amidase-like [Salvelinus fontinalis]|uniref:N-acetylmuramoyl-L-alanine amidase-like n=1 Tax=Salvelinus fontinalis TaxID=8038 RepID=UPI0024856024|nr:N-acetylmuramoyl-L-alanine amidase-like [Salvelinus fontinalis]XP_055743005.1 N-acetylmuramoyl-L-alanine amidase-like [Salvelinus fontinalis]